MVRVYEIEMLHYTPHHFLHKFSTLKAKSELDDIEYAFSTGAKIAILLHYLSCLWIYIGSEEFIDYEPGYLPW